MKKRPVLLFIVITLVLSTVLSCDHNVYIDDGMVKKNIWRLGSEDSNLYFETANEAIEYLIEQDKQNGTVTTGLISIDRTITLTRPVVSENECEDSTYLSYAEKESLRTGIHVPKTFTGELCIDFGNYRYDFANNNSYFFRIEGGDNVLIYNGQSVIYNEADHDPYAIFINSDTVTLDEHLVDDRRVDPADNSNNLIYVGEEGHLVIDNINPTEGQNAFSGKVAVVTDGNTGAVLDIQTSNITIDNIYTMYKAVNGTVSQNIDSEITIQEEAKSHININSGDITIRAINQETDYFNADTDKLFDKAVLNICGNKEDTTITTPHEIEETISNIVDDAVEQGTGNAEHIVLHKMEAYEKVEPTCTTTGTEAYWICTDTDSEVCNSRYYLDENGTSWTDIFDNLIIPADSSKHVIKHVDLKPASCTEDGLEEYWYCSNCGKYFKDVNLEQETTLSDLVIESSGHSWQDVWSTDSDYHWHECSVCNAHEEDIEHSTTNNFLYDDDKHWKICSECGATYSCASHTWGPEEPCEDGLHVIRRCTVCGVVRNQSEPQYYEYNIGIATIIVPKLAPAACGEMVVTEKDHVVTVEFVPHQNSNLNYTLRCYTVCNGYIDYLTITNDGKFEFVPTSDREYKIVLQVVTIKSDTISREQMFKAYWL